MKPTITEPFEEELHTRLMTGLSNLKDNLELYLTDELLPIFYSKYVARCKEDKIEYVFTFEQYVQNAHDYISEYHAIRYEIDMHVFNKTLPSWSKIRGKEKEKSGYYAIYQDIINLAEKGPPPSELFEKGAIMIDKIGVKPKVASIMELQKY